MKTIDAINFFRGIERYNTLETPMPSKLTYAVNLNRGRVLPVLEAYDESMREVIERYALRDEDGNKVPAPNGFRIDETKSEAYLKEVNELQSVLVQIPIHYIELSALPETIPPAILSGLHPMIRAQDNAVVPLHPVKEGDAA